MIQVYIGDGKGKSTAALGLLIRAVGAGGRALYCQFLKSNDSSELNVLPRLEKITRLTAKPVKGFFEALDEKEKSAVIQNQRELFVDAARHIESGEYSIAVLDELLWAYEFKIISKHDILKLLDALPRDTELVLTGGRAPEFILEKADYVSKIKKIKHPFDKNTPARRGIEY